jgi:FAD/FMN-containing dehydrogenase
MELSNQFFTPTSEKELQELVLQAKTNNLQIRVRGSAHSVKKAIFTDDYNTATDEQAKSLNLMLSDAFFRQIKIDTTANTVTVGAGCNLGKDPFDPTETSTLQNSLLYRIF